MRTIAITDYRLKSATLAKVIVSFTGDVDARYIHEELSKRMDYQATPVQASFKMIKPGVAVGFVKANRAIRHETTAKLREGYRVMSSNILMDNGDKSLWEVKNGAAGKYLARHKPEDLSALVEAATQRRQEIPGLRHLAIARAASQELVAFVDDDGDVDHGFAVAGNDTAVKVVSFNRRIPVNVDYDNVVSINRVPVPQETQAAVLASMTPEEKRKATDYWKRLYSYDPEYLREVIKQVNEGTEA